jgi:hypothetical protein
LINLYTFCYLYYGCTTIYAFTKLSSFATAAMNGRVKLVHFVLRREVGDLNGLPQLVPNGLRRHHSRQPSTLSSATSQGTRRFHFKYDGWRGPLHGNLKHSRSFSTATTTDVLNDARSNESTTHQTAIQAAVDTLKEIMESKPSLGPQQIDIVLERLESQRIQPSFECYYWAIECLCRTKRKGSEELIDELFQKLRQSNQNVANTTERREQLQTAMMHTLRAYHHVSNAHRAEELLLQVAEDVEDQSFVTMEMCRLVLSTWSRSDSSRRASRAETFLSIMDKDEALPDPDIACYTLVLNNWASSNKENAPRRAELLLRSMELDENKNIHPNMMSYTCVLNAWARSQHMDAPSHAERLFREMRETKGWAPDRVVYTAMISTWGRAKVPESILKAEEYFQELKDIEKEQCERHDIERGTSQELTPRATVVEYSALIQAWANYVDNNVGESRRTVVRVEELLDELMEKYFDANFRGVPDAEMLRPNRMTFASVFRAINSARRIPNRGDRADAVFQKMHQVKLEPNAHILGLIEKCKRSGSSTSTKGRNGVHPRRQDVDHGQNRRVTYER